jgi:glycerophosphoryl diester phosphodiesterase
MAQLIVAHRGASHDAPENTMAAFELAWQQGADGIEADFHLTADGHVLCIHDADTARTAGIKLKVVDSTLEQLQQLDVGSWKGPQWASERMPTLGHILQQLPADKWFFIELKTGPEIVPPVQRLLADYAGPTERLVIISFNQATIARCAELLPEVRRHWLVGFRENPQSKLWEPDPEQLLADWKQTPADGIGFHARPEVLTATLLDRLIEAGLKEFHTWTIDDPQLARHFQALGTHGITTNRPQLIRQQLEHLNPIRW